MNNVLQEIIDFNNKLNTFNYGMPIKGKIYISFTNEVIKKYRTLSPEEFEKYKCGICWDFVHYEAKWFKDHNYKYECYYLELNDNYKCPTHTFLIFYIENRVYYFESSWYTYRGLEEFKNKDALIETITQRHIKENKISKSKIKEIIINKIDLPSKEFVGLSIEEYMNKVKSINNK